MNISKNLLLSSVFLCSISVCSAQWVQQVSGSTTTLQGVFAVDADTVYVADDNGTIRKTTDGGTTWGPNNINGNATCWDVAFISKDTGVVVGRDHAGTCNNSNRAMVTRTFDAGQTWECDTLELFDAQWIKTVYWASSMVGYAPAEFCGPFSGKIHKTIDGGLNWDTIVAAPFSGGGVLDAYFLTEDLGWMVGSSGLIRKTTDGGLTWVNQNFNNSSTINSIWMFDANNGILCGDGGLLRRTNNGGTTWLAQISTIVDYKDMYFINATDGWRCGSSGSIWKTTNAGVNWTAMTTPVNSVLIDIHFTDAFTGYCVGNGGVILKFGGACSGFSGSTAVSSDYNGSDVSCVGDTDGEATASQTGGQSPYTYDWSSGGSTSVETNLGAGTYTVTITDDNGCSVVETVTLTDPPTIITTSTHAPASCGQSDGTATVVGTGGSGSLQYLWDANAASQATQTATGLAAGIYYITLTDENGCTLVDSVTVTNPNAPVPSIQSQTNVLCNGECNGGATVTQTGGQSPFTYNWSSTSSTASDTLLCPGTYTVTITDANNCSAVFNVNITEPPVLTGSVAMNPETVNCDGDATATPSGGTTPYSYQWDDTGNQTTAQATGLCDGSYCVTVTDANGCTWDTCGISIAAGVDNQYLLNSIKVFPNPSSGSFTVLAPVAGSFELVDGVGRVVKRGNLNSKQLVGNIPSGVYFISLRLGEQVLHKKIIISNQ